MMQKQSPPKHRHDGTSPLPLGMDWSSPPKKWDGRVTVWPHDPHTGWSYCVTIPSWIVLPKSRDAEGIVFYRVQVGIQSPEGVSTARGVLRRFSDFMKLFSELKRAFPKKNLPPAPPKHILRINSSRSLSEERRCSLEEWMGRLLSDIDLSRSVPVASFLELEAAARSSFHDTNQQTFEGNPPGHSMVSRQPSSGISAVASTSSIAPDYGSDTAYETSELGTPRQGRDNSSEIGTEDLELDQDLNTPIETLTYSMSSDDTGLFMGGNILEKLEGFPRHKIHARKESGVTGREINNGNASKVGYFSGDRMDSLSEPEYGRFAGHARKLSAESVGSDISSARGSEVSNTGIANSLGDGSIEFGGGAEAQTATEIVGSRGLQFPTDVQIVLPLDQRHKMNRVLLTMQRRLATAKTDMEDLIARLNQEIAVKEYLTTKVKDLEVELETYKQKSKENLQQAILVERERFTQMQWDMEELRRKSFEMELKLKSEQDEKVRTESTKTSAVREKEWLVQELDSTKQKLVNLQKFHEELLLKSKADTKVLVKEVKSLRNSQTELKQELGQSLKEKSELERVLQKEKQRTEHAKNARAKLLHECGVLRDRLQECSVNLFAEDEDKLTVDSSSLSDALDLLTTSDNRIGFLLAEAQLLAQDDENTVVSARRAEIINGDNLEIMDYETRKLLTDIFIDNARLRKQVNSVNRCALKTAVKSEKDEEEQEEAPSRKTVLNKFLER
ncbi:Phox homologous domain [Macleaya cordata]|uniref:Phox homologous domain n=1 Tax=Macleaya cordata TaxID=56857 RepID=A0A200QTC9_MACCD|nr:Phox homologous domain [Macleaya cordata]